MSAMVNIEIPFVNIMTKMDLVTPRPDDPTNEMGPRNGLRGRRDIARYLEPDPMLLAAPRGSNKSMSKRDQRFHALNQAIVQLVSECYTSHRIVRL
jgi:hypothetical protein